MAAVVLIGGILLVVQPPFIFGSETQVANATNITANVTQNVLYPKSVGKSVMSFVPEQNPYFPFLSFRE